MKAGSGCPGRASRRPPLLLATLALVIGCDLAPDTAVRRLDLASAWEFRRVPSEAERAWPVDTLWRPATVPGTVHTDLLAAGLIGDPYWRANEDSLQWIEEATWAYRTTFTVDEALLEERALALVFDGLDTFADVRLNGETVLDADNMFRAWEVPVRERLWPGANELEVTFRPPVAEVLPAMETHGIALPMGNDRREPPTRAFARKAAYHFGWDWGPRFVTSGVWKPVRLVAWSGVRVTDAHWVQEEVTAERARLRVDVTVEATAAVTARLAVTMAVAPTVAARPDALTEVARVSAETSAGSAGDAASATRRVRLQAGTQTVSIALDVNEPHLWWPAGMGAATLYEAGVEVGAAGRVDRSDTRIGLRTVEVVNQTDAWGESFFLRVNGVPVFARGANWVPADHFTPRVTEADYRRLLASARDANMNMLRVWGGGIYEDDAFYDAADDMGLLVWQDFMFANQMVPADETFVENVAREAEHQIRRLRNHASLALWCGNNEMDEGWHNWGWQRSLGYTAADSATVWEAYERVFHQTLPWAVEVHDPGRFYWPSSPRHGWGRAESMTHGDSHYWGVWWGLEPFEVFLDKVPRFMSEFGFQGMPGMATIRDFTAEEDRFLGSEVLAVHQKHPTGYETVGAYMAREYAVPDDLSDFVYLSQRIQARGMRLAFEAHRRGRPRTMGTLYWQLNDTWPVVSWSSVDHAGRWKALHYAAREAFAPLLVSPVLVDDTVGVWGVWDGPEPLAGRLTVELLHVRGEAIGRWAEAVTLGGASSERVWSLSRSQVLGGADPASVVLRATFEPGAAAGVEPARALLYFVTGGELRLAEPSLALDVTRTPDGTWRVTVGSDVLAPGVHLYLEGEAAHFSDNHFDLAPGESREVVVVPEREDAREDATVERLLRARSLADVVR